MNISQKKVGTIEAIGGVTNEYAKDSESLKRPDLVRPLYLGVEND